MRTFVVTLRSDAFDAFPYYLSHPVHSMRAYSSTSQGPKCMHSSSRCVPMHSMCFRTIYPGKRGGPAENRDLGMGSKQIWCQLKAEERKEREERGEVRDPVLPHSKVYAEEILLRQSLHEPGVVLTCLRVSVGREYG